jgi:hypothetical protein
MSINNNYFGKSCSFFRGQWESDDLDKSGIPELTYCNNRKNMENNEGNCTPKLCPLHKKDKDFNLE